MDIKTVKLAKNQIELWKCDSCKHRDSAYCTDSPCPYYVALNCMKYVINKENSNEDL